MPNNILFPFEGLSAGAAGKLPLTAVDMPFMRLQVAAVGKCLLASVTAIDDISRHTMVGAV